MKKAKKKTKSKPKEDEEIISILCRTADHLEKKYKCQIVLNIDDIVYK